MTAESGPINKEKIMGGITRIHGTVAAPSQRPSTLTFFQIDFAVNMTASVGVVGGAFEEAVKACANFATVAMIGTLDATGGTGRGLRIAIEDTGTDAYSPSGLGEGLPDSIATTALALQAAIRALGQYAGTDDKDLRSATVALFAL
jgi:hypothetical protein